MTRSRPAPIALSDHFNYRRLLRFTFPSVIMLIFTSIYGVVDGFFVSNIVGESAFAAVNFIYPFLMLLSSFGFLFGTGGAALVSMLLGAQKKEKAQEIFTFLVIITAAVGILFAVLGELFLPEIAALLGAEDDLLFTSVQYGRTFLLGTPAFMLQCVFQCFFVTAERPKLGLYFTLAAGISNIILDALFIGFFQWGVVGAAAATVAGQCIGGIIPFFFFLNPKKSLIRFSHPRCTLWDLRKTVTNGFADFMNSASLSFVNMLYNVQLLKYAGKNGVFAYGIIMYISFALVSAFIGFSIGVAPVVSFHFGAKNHEELHNLLHKCILLVVGFSVLLTIFSEIFSGSLAGIFCKDNEQLLLFSTHAIRLYSLNYLVTGLNLFGSAFFAALNNGRVSSLISFLRGLLFQLAGVLILPLLFGVDGIWICINVAEFCTVLVTLLCIRKNKSIYQY